MDKSKPTDVYNVIIRVAAEIRKHPTGDFTRKVKRLVNQEDIVKLYNETFPVHAAQEGLVKRPLSMTPALAIQRRVKADAAFLKRRNSDGDDFF